MREGSASCEKVGNTMPSSRARATARARRLLSTISGLMTEGIPQTSFRLFFTDFNYTNLSKIGCRGCGTLQLRIGRQMHPFPVDGHSRRVGIERPLPNAGIRVTVKRGALPGN